MRGWSVATIVSTRFSGRNRRCHGRVSCVDGWTGLCSCWHYSSLILHEMGQRCLLCSRRKLTGYEYSSLSWVWIVVQRPTSTALSASVLTTPVKRLNLVPWCVSWTKGKSNDCVFQHARRVNPSMARWPRCRSCITIAVDSLQTLASPELLQFFCLIPGEYLPSSYKQYYVYVLPISHHTINENEVRNTQEMYADWSFREGGRFYIF